jgi:hypothetical protein
MANKVSYANLKLKIDNSVSTFDFNGHTIEVLNYLPIEDKYDLVMITLQKAKEEGFYNPIKVEMLFNLHLIYMYTNLSFTDKQKENESKLYDTLRSNGFISAFLEVMNEDEYNELFTWMGEVIQVSSTYRNSAAALLQSVINDLPRNAQAAAEIVNNFNKEDYQAVIDFATAANGGRNINTNAET